MRTETEKAQSMVNALEAQRNNALNQVVQMQAALDDVTTEVAALREELSKDTPEGEA